MKKLLTLAFIIISASVTYAQETPRTEYVLSLSDNAINLTAGESKDVTLNILRSKSFAKSKAELGISSALPAGITVTFEPASGVFNSSVATITASHEVAKGEYQIILRSTIANKTKGSILKIKVGGGAILNDAVTSVN
jgi:hypothetical protein